VHVADRDQANLDALPRYPLVRSLLLDVTDKVALEAALQGKFAALSALPFDFTRYVAEAAVTAGVHYLDLTEDVACTRLVKSLAGEARSALIPQCGLAPGFITIAAYALTRQFDKLKNVHMRVGALPKYPSNGLKYNLTWSTDGLINEYCNPCEAIVNGEFMQVLPLEELESFSLDGVDYEAFNTSGGLGTLCETLAGRARNVSYKTIRYPGHRDMVQMLIRDLKLGERRDIFKELIEQGIPVTRQDVVFIFVTVTGMRGQMFTQETFAKKIYGDEEDAGHSAIQKTTAGGVCAMVDMHRDGKLPQAGFVRQEDADFGDFNANRFGRVYA